MTDDQFQSALLELHERRSFFLTHFPPIPGMDPTDQEAALLNSCPACGFFTLSERNAWEICGICQWEDDGQDDDHQSTFNSSETVKGGPNGHWSLAAYRRNLFEMLHDAKALKGTRVKALLRKFNILQASYTHADFEEMLKTVGDLKKEWRKLKAARVQGR